MIKYYDLNRFDSTHTIRVTLMQEEYVGHVAYKIGGNCKGASLLDPELLLDCEVLVENDCAFQYNEEYDCFEFVLTNPETKDHLFVEDEDEEGVLNSIVSVEIVGRDPIKSNFSGLVP